MLIYTGNLLSDFVNNCWWMSWNIFLAVIPFLLATHLFHPKRKIDIVWGVGFAVFVLFLPNAPYIFTDIKHLYAAATQLSSTADLFFVTLQFLVLIGIGYGLFVASYRKFEKFVLKKKLYRQRYIVRLVSFTTMSVGVYMGRFLRLNSWDVMDPHYVWYIVKNYTNFQALYFIAGFTVLLYVLYLLYEYVRSVTVDSFA